MIVTSINGWTRRVPAWPIYIVSLVAPIWLFWQGATGGLGADPVKAIEHELGGLALKLLILGLCISPLRRFIGINFIKYRRAIGLVAFCYAALHVLVWLILDMGLLLDQAVADIFKRPYIMAGMVGFIALVPLALTSNDWSVRKLGPLRWRSLHRLTYLAGLAAAVHFLWLVKAWPVEPFVYLAMIIGLLILRMPKSIRSVAG